MSRPSKFSALVDELIAEGIALLKTARVRYRGGSRLVDDEACLLWANKLVLLWSIAGGALDPWKGLLWHNTTARTVDSVQTPLAGLKTIRYAIREGLLVRYEDLVFA